MKIKCRNVNTFRKNNSLKSSYFLYKIKLKTIYQLVKNLKYWYDLYGRRESCTENTVLNIFIISGDNIIVATGDFSADRTSPEHTWQERILYNKNNVCKINDETESKINVARSMDCIPSPARACVSHSTSVNKKHSCSFYCTIFLHVSRMARTYIIFYERSIPLCARAKYKSDPRRAYFQRLTRIRVLSLIFPPLPPAATLRRRVEEDLQNFIKDDH